MEALVHPLSYMQRCNDAIFTTTQGAHTFSAMLYRFETYPMDEQLLHLVKGGNKGTELKWTVCMVSVVYVKAHAVCHARSREATGGEMSGYAEGKVTENSQEFRQECSVHLLV